MKAYVVVIVMSIMGCNYCGAPILNNSVSPKQTNKTIKNTITKNDIGYTYLFVKRYPQKFIVKINDRELKSQESTVLKNADTFEVSYEYEWWAPWQIYKGGSIKKYKIPSTVNEVRISFIDWHNSSKISVANAQLLEEKKIVYDQKTEKNKRNAK
jgi:hypothetical protein